MDKNTFVIGLIVSMNRYYSRIALRSYIPGLTPDSFPGYRDVKYILSNNCFGGIKSAEDGIYNVLVGRDTTIIPEIYSWLIFVKMIANSRGYDKVEFITSSEGYADTEYYFSKILNHDLQLGNQLKCDYIKSIKADPDMTRIRPRPHADVELLIKNYCNAD